MQADELHIWSASLERWVTDEQCLSVEELDRAARFRFERHRRRFLAAHSCVRQVLSQYALCRPAELEFTTEGRGKPVLKGGGVHFNLSHSGEILMLAVSMGGPVGVDVEVTKPGTDLVAIARRFFSEDEQRVLVERSGQEQVDAFYRLWTLKEAYVKATGEGLHAIAQRFDLSAGVNGEALEFDGWMLRPLDAPEGCCAALACRPNLRPQYFQL